MRRRERQALDAVARRLTGWQRHDHRGAERRRSATERDTGASSHIGSSRAAIW